MLSVLCFVFLYFCTWFTLTTIDWAPCLPAYAECTLLAFYVLQQLKRENQRWQQYCLWMLTDIASLSLMWDERFKVSGGFKFSNKGDSKFSNPIFGILSSPIHGNHLRSSHHPNSMVPRIQANQMRLKRLQCLFYEKVKVKGQYHNITVMAEKR